MKKNYLLTLTLSLLTLALYGQNGAFRLAIDTTKGTVVYKKLKDAGPGAQVDIAFDVKQLPKTFAMTVVANTSSKNGKPEKEKLLISGSSRQAVVGKLFSLSKNTVKNQTIILVSPKTKDVTKISASFSLNGNNIKINDGDIQNESDSLIVASFGPAQPVKASEKNEPDKSTTANSASPCDQVNSNIRYFIPSLEVISLLADETCSTCKNDYKVAYDLSSGEPKICYYKREECECKDTTKQPSDCSCASGQKYCYVPKSKIRPHVGSTIGFHIFGYYPSFDSLTIDFTFESRNQELKDQFSAAISGTAPKTPNEPDSTKTGETEADSASVTSDGALREVLRKDSAFVAKIRSELSMYYQFLLTASPSQERVEQDVDYINAKLNAYCIRLEEFSPTGLIEAVRELLAKFEDDSRESLESKQRIIQIVQAAATYYGYILNYSTMKVPVVQVPNEDMLKYTVGFYNKDRKLYTGNYSMLIRGGWKIDFSTGIVFNTLMDEEYEIKYDTVDDVAVGQIVSRDKGKFTTNIGLLSHIYTRTGTRFNPGLTFGLVLESGSILKYIGGASLMFGYEQRFVISGGVIAGAVDRLDSSYDDAFEKNVPRSRFSAISSAVPTVKTWDFGGFFSVTYNFGGTTIGK